jgi:glycosyltransferase involved in cell wall biosynthesis
LRIAIVNLTGGGLSGGYKKYLINILPRLSAASFIEKILCVSPHGLNVADWFEEIPRVKFISCKSMKFYNSLIPFNDRTLKNELVRFNPHVLFVPLDRIIKFNNVPTVIMIQNMEPHVGPLNNDIFLEKIKKFLQAVLARRASNQADRVIAISRFVQDFLVLKWQIDEDKISLIYHGFDPKILDSSDKQPITLPHDWQGQFIFSAGSVRPARGLEDLVNAIIMAHSLGRDWPGVLFAGETIQSMIKYREKLTNVLRRIGIESRLAWAGNLNDTQMTWCYRNCQAFVMTSRVEACPNIALEALAHGTINIVANNHPLPEFFQSHAIYYKPEDASSLCMAIDKALSISDAQRVNYAVKSQARAADFSWDTTAHLTLETLKSVAVKTTMTREKFN